MTMVLFKNLKIKDPSKKISTTVLRKTIQLSFTKKIKNGINYLDFNL